ncbi:MAG: penicillin-binding protein activator [Lysobacteraceae bacterium]
MAPTAVPSRPFRPVVLLAPGLLALALAGCASVPADRSPTAAEQQARALADSGRHADAARAWGVLAAQAGGADAATFHLYAAEALWRAGDAGAAAAALAQSPRRRLPPAEQVRHDVLAAALALEGGRAADALSGLSQAPRDVPIGLRSDWYALRARALLATGDRFGAAAALAARAPLLDGEARARALRDAERRLKEVPDAALRQQVGFLADDDALLPLALREARRRGLALDRRTAAAPPAADRPPPATDGYHPPRRMAVLLPLSGDFAAAGQAVRDGLLAGYFAESRARPTVVFLDTAGTAAGAREARDLAVAEGADLLVGPLGRDEVAALASEPMPVAWLALNRTPVAPPGGGSFALAPEDEGAAAAQRLLDQGLTRALAIAEPDDTAQRALAGFRERLSAEGGTLLLTAALDPVGGTAAQALATLAPKATEAQALFLAARAPAVRILMPQREASGLGMLPVLSTSLVQAGADPRLDRELEGLQYPELPWLLGLGAGPGEADAVARRRPSARGSAARLFACGHDAWAVATYLAALRGGATRRGATGDLGVDAAGVVERQPAWAVFRAGMPQPAPDGALLPATTDAPAPPTPGAGLP